MTTPVTPIDHSVVVTEKQMSFQYANECDLELHCSPFGLSGLYIKINGTNIMGIGSTMGLITGSTKGLIHYNDSNDLIDQKYKLYVVVDKEGMLRIDFTKIFGIKNGEDDDGDNPDSGHGDIGNGKQDTDKAVGGSIEDEKYKEEEVPTLIFQGKCPEGRPDDIEPFIGIFLFERET